MGDGAAGHGGPRAADPEPLTPIHCDVAVVGAGALGAACAFVMYRKGADVVLIDPERPSSASRVAAGMLAPAFETVLEGGDAARAAMLRAARDLWPELADAAGIALGREGARWVGPGGPSVAAFHRLGFSSTLEAGGVFTSDDWRLDAEAGLAALVQPVRRLRGTFERLEGRRLALTDGRLVEAGQVVIATGARGVSGLPSVQPIKGQIVQLACATPPCVLRTDGAYVVPCAGGVLVGATMEPGVDDLSVAPAATERLLAAAVRAWPAVAGAGVVAERVGVRGATADGLPLVGPLGPDAPGVLVALGPRRNGWLLAPLVARLIASYSIGTDPGPYAAALDPLRSMPP